MLDHIGVGELARRVVQIRKGIFSSHLVVEVNLETTKLLTLLSVHLIFEILEMLLESINV